MRRVFHFLVFRLLIAYHYFWWSSQRGYRKKHGCYGIAGFRFCLRHRIWFLLWAAIDYTRFHWSSFGFRNDRLRILQVSLDRTYLRFNQLLRQHFLIPSV